MLAKELIDASVRMLLKMQADSDSLPGGMADTLAESLGSLNLRIGELGAWVCRGGPEDSGEPGLGSRNERPAELQVLHFRSEEADPGSGETLPLDAAGRQAGKKHSQCTCRKMSLTEISEKFKSDDWTVEETDSPLQPIETAVRLETDREARLRLQFLERFSFLEELARLGPEEADSMAECGSLSLLPVPTVVGGFLSTSYKGAITFRLAGVSNDLPCPPPNPHTCRSSPAGKPGTSGSTDSTSTWTGKTT